MKNVLMLIALLVVGYTLTAREKVTIEARKTVQLAYPEFSNYNVELDNKSGRPLDVAVIDPATGKQVQGFGLGPMGKVVVSVGNGHILTLKNRSAKEVSIHLDFLERKPKQGPVSNISSLSFTLHNSTLRSIPLIIPNVMNPNLSPMSFSGVTLDIGQEIFYKKGISRKLLLVVDENIQHGDKIDVDKLIRELEKKQ
jgi:hypothetical protein